MSKRRVQKMVAQKREWVRTSGEHILALELQSLEEDLRDPWASDFAVACTSLDALGFYFGTLGTLELADGDVEGWSTIATAIDFAAWAVEVRAELFFRSLVKSKRNLTLEVSAAAAVACISPKWQGRMEAVLRAVNSRPQAVNHDYWASRRFEPFVMEMLRVATEGSIARVDWSKLREPYRSVLEAWSDESALGERLQSVCDYHLERTVDDGEGWWPEFRHPPFDLLPVELILVNRVRSEFGLAAPSVDHALVSMIGARSLSEDHDEHPALSSFADKYRRFFGDR